MNEQMVQLIRDAEKALSMLQTAANISNIYNIPIGEVDIIVKAPLKEIRSFLYELDKPDMPVDVVETTEVN